MPRVNNRIPINEPKDLDYIMCYMFDNFLSDFNKRKGLTRKPNPNIDGSFAYEVSCIYTDKAMQLIGRYKNRMEALFYKHFPHDQIILESPNLILP